MNKSKKKTIIRKSLTKYILNIISNLSIIALLAIMLLLWAYLKDPNGITIASQITKTLLQSVINIFR